MVLDADGLNAFQGHTHDMNGKGRTLVITPHPGEMGGWRAVPRTMCRKTDWE